MTIDLWFIQNYLLMLLLAIVIIIQLINNEKLRHLNNKLEFYMTHLDKFMKATFIPFHKNRHDEYSLKNKG